MPLCASLTMLNNIQDFQVIGSLTVPPDTLDIPKFLYTTFVLHYQPMLRPSQINVRCPDMNGNTNNSNWHRDVGGGETEFMTLWTNKYPTEFKKQDGTIVTAQPNDIVLFNNFKLLHRTPPIAVGACDPNRWVMRSTCFAEANKVKVKIYKLSPA